MNSHKKINVILYGAGTLNCSLIRHFSDSELLGRIFVLNSEVKDNGKVTSIGNAAKTKIGEHKKFVKENNIDFAIINSEIYLLNGIIDFYQKIVKLPAVGASKKWFCLEFSKKYGKEFMSENGIKTSDYTTVNDFNQLDEAIEKYGFPIVIKNNFMEAGFGSHICYTREECIKSIKSIIKLYKKVPLPICLAEKFVKGSEISVHYAWDGNVLLPFIPVKDFKPFKGKGKVVNTGGMGSYTPVYLNERQKIMLEKYTNKLKDVFKKTKPDFTGIFVVNLLFTDDEVYTLEFNMRPGITEFETLIELCDFDLLEFYYNLSTHQLDKCKIKYKENLYSGCITVVDKGFEKQEKKEVKMSLKKLLPVNDNNVLINTNFENPKNKAYMLLPKNNKFYTVVNTDKKNPFKNIYAYLKKVDCPNVYYRKDIGKIFKNSLQEKN